MEGSCEYEWVVLQLGNWVWG